MKIVHAADLHLDSPLRGLERYEGTPVEAIRGATRRALDNLVQLCLDEEVALLVIAGDLYDGDWKDHNTGLYFISRISRLTREGIRVAVIRGNHDAATQITRHLPYPAGAYELSTRKADTWHLEDLGVAVHGRSYKDPHTGDNLAASYPEPVAGMFNIGLLHTALDGRPGHAPYAPCTLAGLVNRGYQYWALGHVHAREELHREPWVVFSGNLQGRHARETGPKGATLITVSDGQVTGVEHRTLDTVRWQVCRVDAARADSAHTLLDLAREGLETLAEGADGRLLAVRLEVTGRSPAHRELYRDPEQWRARLRAMSLELGHEIWLEKVRLDTRPPRDLNLSHDDPLAELLRGVGQLRQDPAVLAELLAGFQDLRNKLPPDYRQLDEALDLDDPATLARLLEEVEHSLLPRLLDAREGD